MFTSWFPYIEIFFLEYKPYGIYTCQEYHLFYRE